MGKCTVANLACRTKISRSFEPAVRIDYNIYTEVIDFSIQVFDTHKYET